MSSRSNNKNQGPGRRSTRDAMALLAEILQRGMPACNSPSESGEGGSCYARITRDGAIIIKGADFFEVLRDHDIRSTSQHSRSTLLDSTKAQGEQQHNNCDEQTPPTSNHACS
ncbi:hypothetical protein TYRP_016999 [Tyrophagus putrescentiae]|nr:hypothetical protein TYRP_016999 [Tyrophagus putrescentiae]